MKNFLLKIRTGEIMRIMVLSFIFSVILPSCKKFLAIPPPKNEVVSADAFSNDESATSTVVGLYSQIMQVNLFMLNGAMSLFPGLSADEIYNTSFNFQAQPFAENQISPTDFTTIYNRLWRWGYEYIYQANACLEGLAASHGVSLPVKRQLTGEVKVVRALCYFYLVNLFGDVPLETTTDYAVNAKMARTPASQIYVQMIDDLVSARNLLAANVTPDHTRPDRWAATALLARVYLFDKNWRMAEQLSAAVIDSGGYILEPDPNETFLSESRETIWQLMPVSPYFNTAEGYYFIPANSRFKPPYALTDYLLSAFEEGDLRRKDWVDSSIIGGKTYYYPYKYKVRSGSDKTEYNVVLRLAEQYLIRAEARAHEGDLQGAVSDLNIIRSRAGLQALPETLDQAGCLKAVLRERQTELFTEWGHRWFDLKRTGTADSVLGKEKVGWTATAGLYPIPAQELKRNPYLIQNPGYQ